MKLTRYRYPDGILAKLVKDIKYGDVTIHAGTVGSVTEIKKKIRKINGDITVYSELYKVKFDIFDQPLEVDKDHLQVWVQST